VEKIGVVFFSVDADNVKGSLCTFAADGTAVPYPDGEFNEAPEDILTMLAGMLSSNFPDNE